jgi:hypothetical protein
MNTLGKISRNTRPRRAAVTAAVCLLLLIFGLQLALTVKQESLTWDEGDHIFAGYMSAGYGFINQQFIRKNYVEKLCSRDIKPHP